MPGTLQGYPLAVRRSGFFSAADLMARSLPYALIRFLVLLVYATIAFAWLAMTIGGAFWIGSHYTTTLGVVWFLSWLAAAGALWFLLVQYALHLIECGHVAVLTELVTRGSIGNGAETMFSYGKRIVLERFGEVNALFAFNVLVRAVIAAVNSSVSALLSLAAVPGLGSLDLLIDWLLSGPTRYIDKVIFSYSLARSDESAWASARNGLVYYGQNAGPVFRQALWIFCLDVALTVLLWLALLVPAGAIAFFLLPTSVVGIGFLMTIATAILLAIAIRGAFLKPIFMIMMIVRFHGLVEHQPVNQEWVARLDRISAKFRGLDGRLPPPAAPLPPASGAS